MNLVKSPKTLALLGACGPSAFGVASAKAVVVTWDFKPDAGTSSLASNQSGYDLTIRGAAMEGGLGLVRTPSNEFGLNRNGGPANYLQFDLRSLLFQGFTNEMIQVASLQAGEGFATFGSNPLSEMGTQMGGAFAGLTSDSQFVAIPDFGSFRSISIAAASGRTLPVTFQASVTPIPEMSVVFPIVGLLVAVSSTRILRRRRAARFEALNI